MMMLAGRSRDLFYSRSMTAVIWPLDIVTQNGIRDSRLKRPSPKRRARRKDRHSPPSSSSSSSSFECCQPTGGRLHFMIVDDDQPRNGVHTTYHTAKADVAASRCSLTFLLRLPPVSSIHQRNDIEREIRGRRCVATTVDTKQQTTSAVQRRLALASSRKVEKQERWRREGR